MVRPTVQLEIERSIARVTICRPEARNALGPDEWSGIARVFGAIAGDASVRVVVVRGEGDHFSAGGDIKSMPERLAMPPTERRAQLLEAFQFIRAMRELPKLIIAAIDGACVGAGLSFALACDLRIATDRARFGATFHRIGLNPDFGLLHLLPRAVGPARALELVMTADLIDASRAAEIGLVHRVVDAAALSTEVSALTERLAAGPPVAQALSKLGLQRALEQDLTASLEWEADAQTIVSQSEDAKEGISAFIEKRAPKFQGR